MLQDLRNDTPHPAIIDAETLRQVLQKPLPTLTFSIDSLTSEMQPRILEFETWEGFEAQKPEEIDFSVPFQLHVSLFALGQYLQIPDLMTYSYHALVKTLEMLDPKQEVAPTMAMGT